jgi:chaperonin cofactor prefoldin
MNLPEYLQDRRATINSLRCEANILMRRAEQIEAELVVLTTTIVEVDD